MKTKYEETIGFIKTSFTITKDLFEEIEPHAFRMFTLLQTNSQRIRRYR